ncbi:basement membrane-specific heparan sulfate proteoglycan core protein-like [Physella acuta]|uniref:basement membrane-specific heparan sulfate proteoglycan core protein-like n=1 Tax=Physella acuta TaxID=109671 RepID=UPI0027DBD1D1|nr:basement membrane-specific heparan sulfate proteoglycan core protein-like [Physella acuta]
MGGRTSPKFVLRLLASLCFFGAILASEIQDFDFADSENVAKVVVKRASSLSDDEDLLMADPTSTPEDDAEGSGTTTVDTTITTTFTVPLLPYQPRYFRVTIRFTNLEFTPELQNRNNRLFQQRSKSIESDIEYLFRNIVGGLSATVLKFGKGSLEVTFDLGSQGDVDEAEIRQILEEALRSGRIGSNTVTEEGFSFEALPSSIPHTCNTRQFFCAANKRCIDRVRACDGHKDCPDGDDEKLCPVSCPNHVGRLPDKLPRTGDSGAHFLINNAFPCDGKVISWEYYRLIPQGTAYVGVWRQVNDEFLLVKRTALPSGQQGQNQVEASEPIQVKRGDFIGIFYPESAPQNVIAQARLEDDAVMSTELYQTYYANLYNENIGQGKKINLNNYDVQSTNATFSIRAIMDYDDSLAYSCEQNEFDCGNGFCIEAAYKCDKQEDCDNGIDEQGCEVSVSAVTVGATTRPATRPATRPTTPTDPCLEGRFRCTDGSCVARIFICDGTPHCPDGLDETHGCKICRDFEFQCLSKEFQCVPLRDKCNGRNDCADGSDEMDCVLEDCSEDQFQCSSGETRCIPLQYKCNQEIDCADGSDEIDCSPACLEYLCYDGKCISNSLRCDSKADCSRGEDEYNCPSSVPCRSDEFRCEHGKCIPIAQRCDKKRHCSDGTDELDCPCKPGEFKCQDGGCVVNGSLCDAYPDCEDGSDEFNCDNIVSTFPPSCPANLFRCDNGICIESSRQCDNVNDCLDGSDEKGCATCGLDDFRCADGECIPVTLMCDSMPDCSDGSDEIGCVIKCSPNQWTCSNGECVSSVSRCNKIDDCSDSSDEQNCPCTPTEFACVGNGECIPDHLRCDGKSHCEDGSDEIDCPCSGFLCNDGTCLLKSQQCDRRVDCTDGSDELNCERCRRNQFECLDGTCVDRRHKCDRSAQCPDSSDEFNCTCTLGEFRCNNGQCILIDARCDRSQDCVDGSDEFGCRPICRPGQFQCNSGECIDSQSKCDGRSDCSDGSDEDDCPRRCPGNQFQCGTSQCVDRRAVCNGRPECPDGSDEVDCPPCSSTEFTCNSGQCISDSKRCDRRSDCWDGSDEINCRCNDNQFTCVSDGRCIPSDYQCNGRPECNDGSDEEDCVRECSEREFRCGDNECIPRSALCNGRNDCPDGSDEQDCVIRCKVGEFQCGTGQCLDSRRVCNGRRDCPDNSDEQDCSCKPDEFTCNSGQCISSSKRCDRRNDCRDGSDERNCPCGDDQFTCVSDGRCIPASYRCNRRPECGDGSDEEDCVRECNEREFRCSDNECIPRSARCDGRLDCPDGSDEGDCSYDVIISISPQQMIKRVGTSASFICQVTGSPPPRVSWTRRTGGAMPSKAQVQNNRITITDLQIEDSGDYQCTATSGVRSFEAIARLSVEYVYTPGNNENGLCKNDEATCSNGECISRDYVCDGEKDCTDGSDEASCTNRLPCEPNEFRCNNGYCALKIWRCDGDMDCADGSDEWNCTARIPGAPCDSRMFQCRSEDQCIPIGYQCDEEIDCLDRSDEIGCAPPTIVTPPIPEITVEINGTFTIVCEAIGVPTPLIVWRLNWGNIPSGDRVTVTSIEGKGVLTIRNAVPEDAGAYTCEAINNRGSIFAIPDALIIVRRTVGVCKLPRFNAEASTENQCVRCFCFGQTQTCYSSSLQLSQITLGNQVTLVRRRNGLEPGDQSIVQYIPSSREFQIREFNKILRSGSYYWSLPRQYLSKKLNSYGGELTYQVYYEVDNFDVITSDPDVILTGNNITLFHKSSSTFRPRTPTTVRVPLIETAWERTQDGRDSRTGPITEYASRADLMMVLENVTHILIRATYDSRQSLIKLGNVLLTTGVLQSTGLGRAVYVEECTCPRGYTGLSCEDCAPGYYRVNRGSYGRECIACNCNGHSNDCDALTGICRNCLDNTAGLYCDECAVGFVGDPRNQGPDACQPCPCPLTISTNQFSRTCRLDRDRQITCTACQPGYTGRQCERCADGYVGDPMTPGDRCRPKSEDELCDPRGSLSPIPNAATRQCQCKPNVMGQYCNTCRRDTFYLSDYTPYGCIACFCMGVTQACQSTTWKRAAVNLAFFQDQAGLVLTDAMQKQKIEEGFSVDRQSKVLKYSRFNQLQRGNYYWSLPQQFLGNKVTAYGGNLRFTLKYRPGRDDTQTSLDEPLVEIEGNGIVFVYLPRTPLMENKDQSFSVRFVESEWSRVDGERATREHLLMVLADLDKILIRATFTSDTAESSISGISMDIAEDRDTDSERAYTVEQCSCPRGYKGLSCEDCDTGYTRSGSGLYLGLCEPCRCNKHSAECDAENGDCRNCRHNTEGQYCERCARGYYGVATNGFENDCQKCPCPLTDSPNQFSTDCILESDGQVTCTACPAGHTGRRCERCAPGYQGNPMRPGDYCKLINVTCDCDERGTVPNTLCDPVTKQCQCKSNVQGRRCDMCKRGYFHLNDDNQQGCTKCFCMGISNQCSSANYYREEIRPMLNEDGSHNFMLVNRRLTRNITEGFSFDEETNDVTFVRFGGIQRSRESLFIQLPPKFRGDKVSSYGGYLKFGLSYTTASNRGLETPDVDVEIIGRSDVRLYLQFRTSPRPQQSYDYEILLVEDSFRTPTETQKPTRETFLSVLSDISAILIRATYYSAMETLTLKNLRMETAVPQPNGNRGTPEVEYCRCPEGYSGLSCQQCSSGYLRVEDPASPYGRCIRCNCNGHATSCDPNTGTCLNCLHNTEGDRCERCATGYYGDPTSGTPSDCRQCACPLTIASNNFSPTCMLAQDNRITCTRCRTGYTGRDCGECAEGYTGNPRIQDGKCERIETAVRVTVTPTSLTEQLGSTAIFQCVPNGRGPFNVVWSRLDRGALPSRAVVGPGPNYKLTISNLEYRDEARYVCTVSNTEGTYRGYTDLVVQAPSTPIRVRIEGETRIVARPGVNITVSCVAVQYSSAANYVLSWMRESGRRLPPKVFEQNGQLVIPNIDEDDLGVYTCTGSQPGSTDRVNVTIVFGTVSVRPNIRIEPRFLRVAEGDSVEFRCNVLAGSPRPTVVWSREKAQDLPAYVYTDETGVLRIPAATSEDQDSYYCTATNSAGTLRLRTVLYVTPAPTPPNIRIIVPRVNITVNIGATERLQCSAEGSDDVNLSWSKDGGLPPGAIQENGVLTIVNVQPSHQGNYVCTGTTDRGVVGRATITVTVTRYERPTVRVEQERVNVGYGTTGILRCIVTGDPRPTVTWTKSGGPLSSNHQAYYDTLRINQAKMEDRGYYTCVATNSGGSDRASIFVDIERREDPQIRLLPSSQQVAYARDYTYFHCEVTEGRPTPVVTWTRAGGQRFTSRTRLFENGTIAFTNITSAEQGEYMCTATNQAGTATQTATLRVQAPPVINLTPGKNITITVGERINIDCVAIGEPVPTVIWRSGQRRRSDVLPEASDSGPGSASLVFESIDKSDGGKYICTASNRYGRTEETVDINVVDEGVIIPRIYIEGPSEQTYGSSTSVSLPCRSSGLPNPRYSWRRADGRPLPPGHRIDSGVLTIPNILPEYGGEYICTVRSYPPVRIYNASVYITVTVAPRVNLPEQLAGRVQEPLVLTCEVDSETPYRVQWSKVNGVISPQASQRDNRLIFRQLTTADAGRYQCTVFYSGGKMEKYVDINVRSPPPRINPMRKNQTASVGANIRLQCIASGDPQPQIQWRRENREMPAQHTISNGVLTIYNAQPEDSGTYTCIARSPAGTSQDFTYVLVDSSPVDPSSLGLKEVLAGDEVNFDCQFEAPDNAQATVTWAKADGPLAPTAVIGDNTLTFPSVSVEDAGTYICTVSTNVGSTSTGFKLVVKTGPVIQVQQDYTTAAIGSPARLKCEAFGSPTPQISWVKVNGELPEGYSIDDGALFIPRVKEEDAGKYNCLASSVLGEKAYPVILIVGALVPYFPQQPISYLKFDGLQEAYTDMDIIMSFRPETTDGLLLYNGQYSTGSGDFVCFGLQDQHPIFKFDAGSGAATIKGEKPLTLNQWHTVQLKRHKKNGTLVVNDEPAYMGEAPGQHVGLDLAEPLYIGNVPDLGQLPPSVGFTSGFIGGVSQVQVQGVNLNLGAQAREIVGVQQDDVCSGNKCFYGGTCRPFNIRQGFMCQCPPGYGGDRCERTEERCQPGSCGIGRCTNMLRGYLCICPLPYYGEGCRRSFTFLDPAFNKTSFISYPKIADGIHNINITLDIKLSSLDDGIVLYNALNQDGKQDFIAITINKQHIEFRFDTGSGPAVIRSTNPVKLNEWTSVVAYRVGRQGMLTVDNEPSVNEQEANDRFLFPRLERGDVIRGTSSGDTRGLNLERPLYLGGVDPSETVNPGVGLNYGFVGCVKELHVAGRKYNLFDEAIDSLNVVDCGERSWCDNRPCLNRGVCRSNSPTDYYCVCPKQYTGKNCEIEANVCALNNPCQNNSTCKIDGRGSYRCDCPIGWEGRNCEQSVLIGTSVQFDGTSYAEVDLRVKRITQTSLGSFRVTISTTRKNGLIFWTGQNKISPTSDYVALAIVNGYVQYSANLGAGVGTVTSLTQVDDGYSHTIAVNRTGRSMQLKVDEDPAIPGQTAGNLIALNVGQNVFLGGAPDVKTFTSSRFSENFVGCLSNFKFWTDSETFNFGERAASGVNLTPCLSPN